MLGVGVSDGDNVGVSLNVIVSDGVGVNADVAVEVMVGVCDGEADGGAVSVGVRDGATVGVTSGTSKLQADALRLMSSAALPIHQRSDFAIRSSPERNYTPVETNP
jgi:hypothetical protein